MAFLKDKDATALRQRFEKLDRPVSIINITQEIEGRYCRETRILLEETAALSDKISLQIYDFQMDKEITEKFNIDKIPATLVMADKDIGIRYYGIPGGYEYATLLESIELVSVDKSPLSKDVLEKIQKIDRDIHIQVFVTPTCPYCPAAVATGHAFAHANEHITAAMVEATEFPHLANKYGVMGVPKTIINEKTMFEGALPEGAYANKIFEALETLEEIDARMYY